MSSATHEKKLKSQIHWLPRAHAELDKAIKAHNASLEEDEICANSKVVKLTHEFLDQLAKDLPDQCIPAPYVRIDYNGNVALGWVFRDSRLDIEILESGWQCSLMEKNVLKKIGQNRKIVADLVRKRSFNSNQ